MPKELHLPELAESVVEGEILRWLVEEGGLLEKDQPYVEVMTDKVTVELPSPVTAKLVKHLVKEGDVVAVHAPIALVDETAAEMVQAPAKQPVGASLPDKGEELSLFKPNSRQEEVKNPFAAQAVQAHVAVGAAPSRTPGRVLAVPAARKLARQLGVDIARVQGSGPLGRVRVDDVKSFSESGAQKPRGVDKPAAGIQPSALGVSPVQYKTPKGYEALEQRVPMRGLRRAIAQQMVASHLYTVRTLSVDEADMTVLAGMRERLKAEAEKQGVKLSYLPFIFKAIARSLEKFPSLNSSLDEARQEIVLKQYYNIGMAVATDAGLVVPVVKDVNKKSVLALANEINQLAEKARAGKLAQDDVVGSTFSITNIGSIGALFSFPIINVPDAAIMGIHSILDRPVVREGQIVARKMMYLSLSFDHRLVDGAEAARFCKDVIWNLENPDVAILTAV